MAYLTTHAPGHPKADMFGRIPIHILVTEQKIGRPLIKREIVHHKNCDKGDNRGENLQVLTLKQHGLLAEAQARYLIEKGLLEDFWANMSELKWCMLEVSHRIRELELAQQERASFRKDRKPTNDTTS